MGEVISWKTAQEIIEYLMEQNQLVSGMSVAEAAAALGFTKTASGLYVKTIITTSVETVAGATAGAAVPVAGAGATTTATNLVLFEGASGTAEVGGLASAALPVAACVLAAAGGYLIGSEVYKQNDEFLDKMMFPLYDFVTGQNIADTLYDNPPTIPMIFNSTGNIFMDARAQLALLQFLDGENTLPHQQYSDTAGTRVILPLATVKLPIVPNIIINVTKVPEGVSQQPLKLTFLSAQGDVYLFFATQYNAERQWTNYEIVLASKESFGVDIYDGISHNDSENVYYFNDDHSKPVYYIGQTGIDGWISTEPNDFVPRANVLQKDSNDSYLPFGEVAYAMIYGSQVSAGLPDGILQYIPQATELVKNLTFPDELPEWVPISLPGTVPGVMPEPIEYPDPAPNPIKINPFINPNQPQPEGVPIKKPVNPPAFPIVPVPNGLPSTSIEPYPRPDPTTDPSQIPGNIPSIEDVPIPEPEIIDTGTVPQPPLPIIPTISSAATGLLHVYNPTDAQINSFGSWLWTTFSGDLIDTISKLFNNPMDAVIGLHELYATPITGSETTIKAGYLDSQVASRLVTSRYSEIKCGAISVPEYWGNYLDYSPYTKTFCYLPFIGVVELNTDDIVGSGVEITYKIDSYNGSCIALITTAKSGSSECVTYEFSGNCAVEIPITSGMKSAVQSALIGAATAAIAASTGGGGIAAAAMIGGARQGGNSKNLVQHSGSFGSSYGAMGIKVPFIIVKRPKQKVVVGYNDNYGYPSHKMVRISDCSGYLKAIEVDVVSPTATENEKKLIEKQLKDGIFVN